MANPSADSARDFSDYRIWMWVWCAAATVATAVAFGVLFPYQTVDRTTGEPLEPGYGWPAFMGGLVIGAIACIPVMIGVHTLFRIQHNTALAADRLRVREPRD
ncbi:hypothetical protein [Demequina lignilytica]|uniref:Uncharacterized protein n=1 Tax=Demequina lignilytica TaxID=3051663 RepID=A0AAW7M8T7_9MICO|nr:MULTISPECIES: hypothetical protein [unclassified Demequina]MDN4477274.1 hypothetical protein [Demequina sp. SYSU T00039-1]MDN4483801.1 hypothetical protein [Demequina sp. SYSU T0a273]MDN4487447.1 hypothetical protein [Demequina sp. SYSU T00039]MDN4491200.1 hypothetical protein [Demequina sp. SYSU T00068]